MSTVSVDIQKLRGLFLKVQIPFLRRCLYMTIFFCKLMSNVANKRLGVHLPASSLSIPRWNAPEPFMSMMGH